MKASLTTEAKLRGRASQAIGNEGITRHTASSPSIIQRLIIRQATEAEGSTRARTAMHHKIVTRLTGLQISRNHLKSKRVIRALSTESIISTKVTALDTLITWHASIRN